MALRPNSTDKQIETSVNEISRRLNNKGDVVLKPGSLTTVVTDPRIFVGQLVQLIPLNAVSASQLLTTFVSSVSKGSFTITHTERPGSDRKFGYVIF